MHCLALVMFIFRGSKFLGRDATGDCIPMILNLVFLSIPTSMQLMFIDPLTLTLGAEHPIKYLVVHEPMSTLHDVRRLSQIVVHGVFVNERGEPAAMNQLSLRNSRFKLQSQGI